MNITILIFNDGRNDYLSQTLASLHDKVKFPQDAKIHKILYDDMPDSRDEEFLKKIKKKYKIDQLVFNGENEGINKSVQKAWALVPSDTDYIFHQENDFTYNETVEVSEMIKPLEANRLIGQVALLRQPWYPDELATGGVYQKAPERFSDANVVGVDIVVHNWYFTHNPCIYPAKYALQLDKYHEWIIANELKQRGVKYFAYLGKKSDPPKVHHIGEIKKGVGDV